MSPSTKCLAIILTSAVPRSSARFYIAARSVTMVTGLLYPCPTLAVKELAPSPACRLSLQATRRHHPCPQIAGLLSPSHPLEASHWPIEVKVATPSPTVQKGGASKTGTQVSTFRLRIRCKATFLKIAQRRTLLRWMPQLFLITKFLGTLAPTLSKLQRSTIIQRNAVEAQRRT